MTWRGDWDGAAFYDVDDAVMFAGSSYIAVQANSASPPPSAEWNLLAGAAVAGSPGPQGPAGPQGPPGAAGTSVVATVLSIGDSQCPFGGTRFDAGSSVAFACNGSPAAPAKHFSIQGDVAGRASLTLVHNLGTSEVNSTAWVQDDTGVWKELGVSPVPVKISAATLGDALSARWLFDEPSPAFIDAGGNGLDLTLRAGTGVTQVPGVFGSAARFDGQTVVQARLTGIPPGPPLSFGAWVFLNATGNKNQTPIMAAPSSPVANTVAFGLFVNAVNTLQCQGGKASTAQRLQGWHHAVCTIDPDTMLQHLYIDGQEAAAPSVFDQGAAPIFYVGGIPPPSLASGFFTGAVDEAFVANRLLSPSEIQTLMGGLGGMVRSSVKDFRVEEPDGNTVVLYNDNRQLLRLRLDVGP